MNGDVCYPLSSPSGSLKWAELFSSDLTLSQALMVMSHSLLGLSPQLEPPCSENKSQVWPLTGNEPQADSGELGVAPGSRTLWSLPAAGLLHWQAQQTGISTTVELSLRLTRDTYHSTGERKQPSCHVTAQHKVAQPSPRATGQAH